MPSLIFVPSTACDAWLGLANYNEQFSQSRCAWINEQQDVILSTIRYVQRQIKKTVEKSTSHAGEKSQ